MHLRNFEQAPIADDYLKALQHDESLRDFRPVPAGQVKLTPGGLLAAGDQTFELAGDALADLAKLARIPGPYFEEIDPELRAVNFNRRLPRFLGSEEALAVTISKDNAVHRVERPRFGQIPASLAIEAILDVAPAASISNDIRVIEYERDRRLDVAVVAAALQTLPRHDDIVCGGVHLTIEESGAVQVGPESFRLACLNGAMARVRAGGQHRLRRGMGSDSERKFIVSLREFGPTAWRDWEHVRKGLEDLARKPLDRGDIGHVIHGLRQSPFFISGQAAGRVDEQLRGHGGDLNFYDLHNAITYVGTHDSEVLPQYRYRLRLGAGQLARGRVGVCNECRRLMIGAEPSLN